MLNAKRPPARLDVRALPPPRRHECILRALDELDPGTTLTVVTDHEPRPLRYKIESRRPDRFLFRQRHLGVAHWEVDLRPVPPSAEPNALRAFLRRCVAFADAAAETLSLIEDRAFERTFPAGATIVEQDVVWPFLGLVRAGMLESVMTSAGGRDHKLFDILTGETFGIVEVLDGGRTVARIAAGPTPAQVVLVPRETIVHASARDAALARALTLICAQRTRRLAERYADHQAQPALARVAAALLPYASLDAGLAPALDPLRRITQAQLALAAGTAKEVAARAIAELEAGGAIERAHGHIARIDRAKLSAFAKPPG